MLKSLVSFRPTLSGVLKLAGGCYLATLLVIAYGNAAETAGRSKGVGLTVAPTDQQNTSGQTKGPLAAARAKEAAQSRAASGETKGPLAAGRAKEAEQSRTASGETKGPLAAGRAKEAEQSRAASGETKGGVRGETKFGITSASTGHEVKGAATPATMHEPTSASPTMQQQIQQTKGAIQQQMSTNKLPPQTQQNQQQQIQSQLARTQGSMMQNMGQGGIGGSKSK